MSNVCKPRSRRYPVSKPAVMKAAGGHRLVSVINASQRGLGLRGRDLPSRGEYVEIRLQEEVIVGRVAWSSGARCGVQTQDVVALRVLTDSPVERDAAEAGKTAAGLGLGERRRAGRRETDRQELIAEASRSSGRIIEFGFLGALVFAAGVFAADAVRNALSAPMRTAEAVLAGRDGR